MYLHMHTHFPDNLVQAKIYEVSLEKSLVFSTTRL